jgi:hypothetical protein
MHLQRGRRTKLDREITALNLARTARNRTITAADRKARWRLTAQRRELVRWDDHKVQSVDPTGAPWNAVSAFANCGRAVAHGPGGQLWAKVV